MAARLTCKNYKSDSPQRWLGSLRSPNQRCAQSPCGREVARVRRPILLQPSVAAKIATRTLYGLTPLLLRLPGLPGADRNMDSTAEDSRHRLREFAAGGSYVSQTKRACPVPCSSRTIWTEAGPENKNGLDAGGHTKPLTCLSNLFCSNRLRWSRTSRRIKRGNQS